MNAAVLGIVKSRAALELEDRQTIFGCEVRDITEQLAARRLFPSGQAVFEIEEAVKREARVRTVLVWTPLARALSSSREILTSTTAQEAKDLISNLIRAHSSDLQRHLDSAPPLTGDKGVDRLGPAIEAALHRINSEVDFALLASAGVGSDVVPQIVNIYQSQGIVQTGYQASASMVINVTSDERREIKLALSAAREALERDTGLSGIERRQAIELIDETVAEADKEHPNRLKLRGGLQSIAATIQTVAAAPQVYGLVKGAAALFGLDLP